MEPRVEIFDQQHPVIPLPCSSLSLLHPLGDEIELAGALSGCQLPVIVKNLFVPAERRVLVAVIVIIR